LRSALEAQIAGYGLTDRIRLLGHRSDVERLFAALDVFVLPSKSEGMSNTILEAMASGMPIVATNVGGAEELVDDGRTGFLVPAGDTAALAGAIANLVANPALRLEMGTAGRVKAHNEFSLDRMVGDYAALYVGLAQRLMAGASA
jgi:glycosyltransferase involved in cell wall biosynthesis